MNKKNLMPMMSTGANVLKSSFVMVVLFLWVLVGCASFQKMKNAYVVFIDYTKSAATFYGNNPDKIKDLLQQLTKNMDKGDILEVYPIHAYTASATPLLRLQGPELIGDLRDKQKKQKWIKNTALPGIENIWNIKINHDAQMLTNIYPTVNKIHGFQKPGYTVKAYVICDMIQDYAGEDFAKILQENSDTNPLEYAQKNIEKYGVMNSLNGISVKVLIPGSVQGSQAYDRIRHKVNMFWQEFYSECGADVKIEDL